MYETALEEIRAELEQSKESAKVVVKYISDATKTIWVIRDGPIILLSTAHITEVRKWRGK
jgi:hypothetical protein